MDDMTMANEPDTELVLVGLDLPRYSARGLRQTLEPIDAAGSAKRTVNGSIVQLAGAQFRKFKTSISGSDVEPPAFDGMWPGMILEVDCVAELVRSEYSAPDREVVPGSEVTLEGGGIKYRPRLTMMLMTWQEELDEWGRSVGWSMELEEA